jgi:peptidoglycan hydrolase CwlO-like protein
MSKRTIIIVVAGLAVIALLKFFILPSMTKDVRAEKIGASLYTTKNIISDAEAYDKYISRSEREVERFGKRIDALKARVSSLAPEQQTMLTDLEAKLVEFSNAVADLKNKTTREDKDAAVTTVKNIRKEITTQIRALGGRTTSPSDS